MPVKGGAKVIRKWDKIIDLEIQLPFRHFQCSISKFQSYRRMMDKKFQFLKTSVNDRLMRTIPQLPPNIVEYHMNVHSHLHKVHTDLTNPAMSQHQTSPLPMNLIIIYMHYSSPSFIVTSLFYFATAITSRS